MKMKPKKQCHKRYLDVQVQFLANGRMVPTAIIWDDEHHYPIQRVLHIIPQAAYGAGGQGDCYTVLIAHGALIHERRLFFERSAALSGSELGRWFVEAAGD